jgi:hypothetical protein
MPSTEEQIQKTVVSIEAGALARWIWRASFVAVAMGLFVFYQVHEFRGLPVSQAMDQAQIGRELLRGHGWATKVVRPLAMGELQRHGKDVKSAIWYDTYNAPIPPLLDAAAIFIPFRMGWTTMSTHEFVYPGDRAMACMETVFYLGALVVMYYIALELFDERLALIATGLVLVSDIMWRYSLSGLPQMFLLLVLHLSIYALLRAMRAGYTDGNVREMLWLAAVGGGFGVMALTHALTIFIFVPVLVYTFVRFGMRAGAMVLGIFAALYAPWLVRNAMVCGDFRGMAGFSGLDGIVHNEAGHMRRFIIDLGETTGNYYAQNFRVNLTTEVNRLVEYMGWSWLAPVGFVSLLHAFRRPVTASFRTLMFAMFAGAVVGMGVFGIKDERGLGSNQFYLLFIPMLTCYGAAYVLVQWDRRIGLGFILPQWSNRSASHKLMRGLMVAAMFLVTGVPLLLRLLNVEKNAWQIEWPPYAPPAIATLRGWTTPDEIIGTDMPWAVAWYADRRSLWLPYEPHDLIDISDYQKLGAPVVMLYFTPVSGTENTLEDLLNGEYRPWWGYIMRLVDLSKSPYPVKTMLGLPECVVYMDRDRRVEGPGK